MYTLKNKMYLTYFLQKVTFKLKICNSKPTSPISVLFTGLEIYFKISKLTTLRNINLLVFITEHALQHTPVVQSIQVLCLSTANLVNKNNLLLQLIFLTLGASLKGKHILRRLGP